MSSDQFMYGHGVHLSLRAAKRHMGKCMCSCTYSLSQH